jgi:hypothetical protein
VIVKRSGGGGGGRGVPEGKKFVGGFCKFRCCLFVGFEVWICYSVKANETKKTNKLTTFFFFLPASLLCCFVWLSPSFGFLVPRLVPLCDSLFVRGKDF